MTISFIGELGDGRVFKTYKRTELVDIKAQKEPLGFWMLAQVDGSGNRTGSWARHHIVELARRQDFRAESDGPYLLPSERLERERKAEEKWRNQKLRRMGFNKRKK